MSDLITVVYEIENIYEDGTEITTTVEADVPPPPEDECSNAYSDWEDSHVFEYTGANNPDGGDAGYFVTVRQSSDPERIKPGTTYEFC